MKPSIISRRGHRLTMLAAKSLLVVLTISLLLAWLGFGQGTGAFGSSLRQAFTRTTGFCLSCKKSDVDPGLPFVKSALDSADIAPELEERARKFAGENGLQIHLDAEQFRYMLFVRNERIEVFVTPATAEGLNSARDKLEEAVKAKIAEMAAAPYSVAFAVDNELVENQKSMARDGTVTDTGKLILARSPRLYELYGVEAAVSRSRPSNLATGDKVGIKFYFLRDSLYKEESHFAYFTTDKDGRAAVYITAGTTDSLKATELDAPAYALPTRYGKSGTFFDTVESLLLHELAHNHQARMGWEKDAALQKAMNDSLGFVSFEEAVSRRTVYLIKVQAPPDSADKSVRFYRLGSRSVSEKDKRWYRTDVNGAYLDAAGKVVDSEAKSHSLTNLEVQNSALVPPSSHYFDTPTEIFAEALKAIRMGGEARRSLYILSPQLYKIARTQDQLELNAYFGYVKVVEKRTLIRNGEETAMDSITRLEPTQMRGWDGLVVPFSETAQKSLADAEAAAQLSITTP